MSNEGSIGWLSTGNGMKAGDGEGIGDGMVDEDADGDAGTGMVSGSASELVASVPWDFDRVHHELSRPFGASSFEGSE